VSTSIDKITQEKEIGARAIAACTRCEWEGGLFIARQFKLGVGLPIRKISSRSSNCPWMSPTLPERKAQHVLKRSGEPYGRGVAGHYRDRR